MAFCWFMLTASCFTQMGLSVGRLTWYHGNSGLELGFTQNCSVTLTSVPPETNLRLLLAMVAREQVDNDTATQRGNERAPVIWDFGLLPHRHLQQRDTNSPFPAVASHLVRHFTAPTALTFKLWSDLIHWEQIFIFRSVGAVNLKKP